MSSENKELVIEAHIPLPQDYMEEVEIAAKVKSAADSFRAGLAEALGEDRFKVFVTRAVPKEPAKPRAPRADAGQPRGPRAAAAATNGAAAPVTEA